jgi:hypothetical protein
MTELIKPVRLQLSRKKGSRLLSPNGLPIVVVSRPSKYGSPYTKKQYDFYYKSGYPHGMTWRMMATSDFELYIRDLTDGNPLARAILCDELRGKNLACWCPLPKPGEPDHCHAAVLLRIANEG